MRIAVTSPGAYVALYERDFGLYERGTPEKTESLATVGGNS
jgi:hypothetical protein